MMKSWIKENPFWFGIILGIIVFITLNVIGCTTKPQIEEPKVGQQATIEIYNSLDVFYTVSINTENNWQDHYVIEPHETITVKLALRPYKVCISREFEVEQTCVEKLVSGDDKWTIRNK